MESETSEQFVTKEWFVKNVTEGSHIIDKETRLARKSDSKCKMVALLILRESARYQTRKFK